MTEDELFKKAWLFLYAAAGDNIGFEVKPAEDFRKEDAEKRTDRPA